MESVNNLVIPMYYRNKALKTSETKNTVGKYNVNKILNIINDKMLSYHHLKRKWGSETLRPFFNSMIQGSVFKEDGLYSGSTWASEVAMVKAQHFMEKMVVVSSENIYHSHIQTLH